MPPRDWAARFRTLRNLFHPAPPTGMNHEFALLWRRQAAALDLFDEALLETTQALDPSSVLRLPEFWRTVRTVLRLKPLRLDDGRRNVVHVLSAHEARGWVLPVVFVCGMVEKQFPQFHPQDPFFPDTARCALNDQGVRVRTAGEFEAEERALFDAAVSRATMLVALSYPEFDARGNRNLPSLVLDDLPAVLEEAAPVRPQARDAITPPGPLAIRSPKLLSILLDKTAQVSPSGLESYLQCPFQYFGGRMLRLKTTPVRAEERLDYQRQGEIVHAVLREWYDQPQPIAQLFERIFASKLEECRIPGGYHTERLRNAMLEDLERFAADTRWPRDGFQSRTEQEFVFPLEETVQIRGRMDRLDSATDGRAYVIDYKYSIGQRVKGKKNGTQLQGPLYVLAAEKAFGIKPTGMFFVGLKGSVEYAGWSEAPFLESDPLPENWLAEATEQALRIVREIRGGRIAPEPALRDNCHFCDCRDVCRIEVRRPAISEQRA
jgi:RecB family exonuclease